MTKKCKHWTTGNCKNPLWIDENGKEHERCQEYICVLCHGNVKSINKKEKQIGQNNQGPLYCCKGEWDKNCADKWIKIDFENQKLRCKLFGDRDLFFDKLKTASSTDSEFLTELRPFFDELWEAQIHLLGSNYFVTPAFTADMLETIRGLIEGISCLTEQEKNNLKLAYTREGGNIDDTLNELEEVLTNISKSRKVKKDLEKLTVEQANYVKKLENLEGWGLLSEDEKTNYLQQIKSFPISSFDSILHNAEEAIKKIRELNDKREREQNRREDNPKDDGSRQPNPAPSPESPNGPSDNSQSELNEIKQRVKSAYNLTDEEFNIIIAPLADKDLLEYVSLLLGKVKEAQNGKITDTDSCLEFLISYQNASVGSPKKKAYEAANNYQQQVDQIITELQSQKQVINSSLSELVKAENEEKLDLIYSEIKKNSELYQNSQKVIDNHEQRTRAAIKLENQPQGTDLEKQLATKLRTMINSDSDKSELTTLQKELSEFKSASEGEKKTVYASNCQIIDLMSKEIEEELLRREKSQKDQEKTPSNNNKNFPESKNSVIPLVTIMASISIILLAFLLYMVIQFRKNKLKAKDNNFRSKQWKKLRE